MSRFDEISNRVKNAHRAVLIGDPTHPSYRAKIDEFRNAVEELESFADSPDASNPESYKG